MICILGGLFWLRCEEWNDEPWQQFQGSGSSYPPWRQAPLCVCSGGLCVFCPIPSEQILNLSDPSVQFSRSVVSDSLRPHESQHARPPCPSPTPGVYSNSCPSSRVHHPAISSSHLILCRPLLLLPPIPPSIRVFSNESTLLILTGYQNV